MKKIIGIGVFLLACTPLVHAQGNDDLLSKHPDARNNREMSELRDRAPAGHVRSHHAKHHRMEKHHRKAVNDRSS